MTKRKDQHVVPRGEEWAVRGAGNSWVTSTHRTQADAIAKARRIAINQHTEVVIHRPDGRIRNKDSFGRDPFPPRG
jgi:nitrous oxidase accessory protein NosD